MAVMYPGNMNEYMPTGSERVVYEALKAQLPADYVVFYSIQWSYKTPQGTRKSSEVDFMVLNPLYGYLCLEVKGGNGMRIEDNRWYLSDDEYGERKLNRSPYEQAEQSMYYFRKLYSEAYHVTYQGIYGAGVVFPFFTFECRSVVSKRDAECTIDASDMRNLHEKIKQMFRSWGSSAYGRHLYKENHHNTFVEIVKKELAVSAAAGSLIEYKQKQMDVVNRVQDSYIYLLDNLRQFYFRGGAGTGKTWIAMKLAKKYRDLGQKTLFLCVSPNLAAWAKQQLKGCGVEVYSLKNCLSHVLGEIPTQLNEPYFEGILSCGDRIKNRYGAILIDEAQDFSKEMARFVKLLLEDEKRSYLGVFYDDVQIFRDDSFGDAFMIDLPPLLLRDNIRNTYNIYKWAVENTMLGNDVVMNPVEGPLPCREIIRDMKHLTHRLEHLFRNLIDEEQLKNESLAVLVDQLQDYVPLSQGCLAKWRFVKHQPGHDEIIVQEVAEFKGLEADMVIYIHKKDTPTNTNYIAYTRAKYYLYELIC